MTRRQPPQNKGTDYYGCFIKTVCGILLLWFWWYFIFLPYVRP